MEWTTQHDILFCREEIAFDVYRYKPGSKERGRCLDRIAESLNSIEEPWLKVDQRSLRDRIKKLLKLYVEKRNKEMRASGVEVEHTELDDLLLDIHERQQEAEAEAAEASEANNKKLDKKGTKQNKLGGYRWSVYQKLRREEVIVMMILM